MNNAVIAVSVCLCGGLGAAARYVWIPLSKLLGIRHFLCRPL